MADDKVKFLRGTSDKYAVAEKDNDTIYFTTDDGKLYIGDKEVSSDGSITIDDELSDTSTNPVQNKVINSALAGKAASSHNQASNTITAMTGYSKVSSASAIAAGDSLNTAIGKLEKTLDSKLNTSLKGAANGLAELDSSGKVPSAQLPSYVDDVLEYTNKASFPATGESGKIYIAQDNNKTYRWSGSAYVEISPSLALGETSATAYRGDRGKIAYDHSQSTHARTDATKVEASTTNGNIKIDGTETTVYKHPSGTNPHGTTKSDVGLSNVPNVTTNDQTPSYTESSSLKKLTSGEKLSVAFGKISKAITDLISHIGNSVIHTALVELTQAEYNALSDDEKNNGTVYYITDISNEQQSVVDYTNEITLSSNVKNKWTTSVKKLGHTVNFVVNITVNEYSGNSITFGTLPEAVRPNKSLLSNTLTNVGTFCYLFVNSDGRFGATKLSGSSWADNDGVRFCFSYIVN